MDKLACICIMGVLGVAGFGGKILLFPNKTVYEYAATDEVFNNPLMGYASSANDLDRFPDSSLVYMDITWKELEPEEGVFDWENIAQDNYLEQWRAEGKNVVLRFVCDVPSDSEHRDIPDWLYEKTGGDGTVYDMKYGKGYSPNYENEDFITSHEKAIEEIGRQLGRDSFVSYVQLGSLGHWGEWHVNYSAGIPRMPKREIRQRYVEPYTKAFPHAKLLMRRPFTEAPEGCGVFNDMAGDLESTVEWLGWIENGGGYEQAQEEDGLKAMPDIWNTAPIGGELTSGLSMEEMLTEEKPRTSKLLEDSHMTFIGPKIPKLSEDGRMSTDAQTMLRYVGYRYRVSKLEVRQPFFRNKRYLDVTWTNDGVAPIYWNWIPCLYLLNENGVVERIPLDIDLTALTQGVSAKAEVVVSKEIMDAANQIAVGIENPETGKAEIWLPMTAGREGTLSVLWKKEPG